MALSAKSVFEVRTGGSDTNGGGFVTGATGTDYSQQNSANSGTPNKSTTDAVTAASNTLTSATAGFTAAIVGNIIYLAGGTGTLTGAWYQVTAFTNITTVTIDRAPGVSTGVTMNIGGALLSPGMACGAGLVAGGTVFIQNVGADGASVYSITSASANVSQGTLGPAISIFIQGYTSTRSLGNTDARPQLQLNVATATMWSAATSVLQNIVCNGNSQTAAKFSSGVGAVVDCLLENFNTASTAGVYFDCAATGNSASIFVGTVAVACEAYGNTATPFTCTACIDCIASGNTGGGTNGFTQTVASECINCIAVSNGQHGFSSTTSVSQLFVNCHAESNTGFGFNFTVSGKVMINCSYFNNTSGGVFANTLTMENIGAIAVTVGSVFVNAAGNNYALNALVNQGALLRGAGHPSIFARGLTANFRDIGAAQHQDSPATNIFVIDD